MRSLSEQLESLVRTVTAETRLTVVEEEIKPALHSLCALAGLPDAPLTLVQSCATMKEWATQIAEDGTEWRVYLDRLLAHVNSLSIVVRDQTTQNHNR